MPLYDFSCTTCKASREVRADYETKKDLELLCMQCGGVMRAVPSAAINIISSTAQQEQSVVATREQKRKACGHKYHCRCSIKLKQPNPFQKEIDKAHGKIVEE